MTPIFYIKGGNLAFGEQVILKDIELYITYGDRICLTGKNGCGKSSLMKVIYGDYELDSGKIYQDPRCVLGFLRQQMDFQQNITIFEHILQDQKEPEQVKFKAEMILQSLKISGDKMINQCSGGQIRRAQLAKALIEEPDILLLDEPTNHLDISATLWLESYLQSYKGAIICISHDRVFLNNITNKTWWIDRSILRSNNRGFKDYDQWREDIIAEEEAKLRNMNKKLQAESGWLSTGVTARRKRNQKRLASLINLRLQLKAHETKLNQAKNKLKFELEDESKKSKFIIQAKDISHSMEGNELIKNLNIKVKKGEKIGIIGPNKTWNKPRNHLF